MATIIQSPIDQVSEEVFEVLNELGIQQHLRGYDYLAYAIHLAAYDKSKGNQLTKVLYPEIAEVFDSTCSRVERAMRHAIDRYMDLPNEEFLEKYFGNSLSDSGSITNSQFVCTLANVVRRKIIAKMNSSTIKIV